METFEERALHSFQLQQKMWIRYVDNTFVIWPHGREALSDFHTHLNQQNPSIHFIMEEESDEKMPFLDIVIERKGTKATTTVYWKPTHTDRYMNFNSHHHPRVLRGNIRCLRDRAHNICAGSNKEQEIKHLRKVFRDNDYPD